jgi:hypothetical protein
MTSEQADQRVLEALAGLGWVAPPSATALAAARESLWSLVTAELFQAGLTEDATRPRPNEASRPAARLRPDPPPQQRRHRSGTD